MTLLHIAQRKHAFMVKTKKVKITKANPQQEKFSGIIASDIKTQVYKVTNGWIH